MKITYLYQYFSTPAMPGGSRGYEMARRLVKSGHEVNLVTSIRDEAAQRRWHTSVEDGINVHWYPVPYSNAMGVAQRLRAFARFAWAASVRAASFDADVVFATSTPLTIAIPGAFASWRRKCPMVFEVRDAWPEMPIAMGALKSPLQIRMARALERFAYARSTRVIALSPGISESVVEAGFPAERVHVVPNSCDTQRFQVDDSHGARFRSENPALGDGPIVLYAGTLGAVNGVTYLARLAAAVQALRPDVRFVVLGDGAEAELLRETATKLGIMGRNFFQYPRMSKERVVDAFSAAAVVTSLFIDKPEMEKNSANKFFDGLAAGRPVAINYGGWQADLIQQYAAGLVLSRDVDLAAGELCSFLQDPERMSVTGGNAARLAEERFSRDQLYSRLHEVIKLAVEEAQGVAG